MDNMVNNKQIVAIIPARGGSTRIFKKNIKLLAGKPLIAYTIEASLNSELINRTIVSTDDKETAGVAEKYGAEVIIRPKEISKDDSPTEQAMIHVVEQLENRNHIIDYVVLLQPTSPLRGTDIINEGINFILKSDADSALTVCETQHYYLSGYFHEGYYKPEYDKRPFSHKMPKKYRENGAFYITKKDCLFKTHNRISGKIKAIEMNELDSVDIDEEKDFSLVEKIILNIKKDNRINKEKLKKIRLVITDIDGVMTDGGMYYSEKGEFLKKFNTRDAKGLELIRKAGIKVAFMTSENSPIVSSRAKKLGIQNCYLGVEEKKSMLIDVCNEMNLSFENIAFIGDDVNDLECMKAVGFSAAPCDAVGDILKKADYVTTAPGGNGAVREVCNLILEYCGAVKNIS